MKLQVAVPAGALRHAWAHVQLDRSVHLGVGRAVHAQGLTASWVSGNGKVEPRRQLYSQDRQRLGYPGSATPALFNSRRTTRSRALFRSSFLIQNNLFVAGTPP